MLLGFERNRLDDDGIQNGARSSKQHLVFEQFAWGTEALKVIMLIFFPSARFPMVIIMTLQLPYNPNYCAEIGKSLPLWDSGELIIPPLVLSTQRRSVKPSWRLKAWHHQYLPRLYLNFKAHQCERTELYSSSCQGSMDFVVGGHHLPISN